jgi:hypothetical protein
MSWNCLSPQPVETSPRPKGPATTATHRRNTNSVDESEHLYRRRGVAHRHDGSGYNLLLRTRERAEAVLSICGAIAVRAVRRADIVALQGVLLTV